ncbi:MAG: GNAT family N-acetyltransferase [Opitutaceae bacterium]|jgi:ribosomal protein S18 acetylase RimI-like enzyme|nr:GNAT family N-acetyltransferase [Opitutaceae bacterium]
MTDPVARVPRSPNTAAEFESYYDLRWRVLRALWEKPRGSERDEFEDVAHHLAIFSNATALATGRLHQRDSSIGQIRAMAVDPAHQKRGLGSRILNALEAEAQKRGLDQVMLHARDVAVLFYEKHGYEVVAPGPFSWGIKHFEMSKQL